MIFIRICQIGWTEKKQQVLHLRFASFGMTLSFKNPGLRIQTNKVTDSQDDDFVGGLRKSTLNKLVLMGRGLTIAFA